jgi:arylsulfatase A-like enzyme
MDTRAYAEHTVGVDKNKMFYETPNLDRMVEEGVAFSQAYACQLCSPTRASILTGKYAARLGFTTATPLRNTYYNQGQEVPEGSYAHDVIYHFDRIKYQQAWINGSSNTAVPAGTDFDNGRDEISIAEALPDYHSVFIGKWHLGGHGAEGYQPSGQGFEPLAWFDAGGSIYFDWQKSWNNKSLERFPNIPQDKWKVGDSGMTTGEKYLTDDLTEQAVRYIDKRSKIKDQPFFLYFCHFAVHTPYQGKDEDVKYFDGKGTKGWNNHDDPIYASMIRGLDNSVGRILDKLEETGLEDNTLVVFMSDNGGLDSKLWPGGTGTDNSPFVGGKACLTEGGIRVPLIFKWKGKIGGGKWCDVPVDCTDILPTLVQAAGYDVDKYYNEIDIDGRSLMSLVHDTGNRKKTYTKDIHYWHYPFNVIIKSPFDNLPLTPHSAIREKNFKLIFDWHGRLKLYDIENDPYEKNNLVQQMPDKTDELFNKLMTWLEENVEKTYWPRPNPNYNSDDEPRNEPFTDLYKNYVESKNIAGVNK